MSDENSENLDAADEAAKPQAPPQLPAYVRHLLKVRVPVTVSLAAKKLAVDEVIALGPGSMINFDKSCDGPLELMVGDRTIAVGSAVKVGEKFGLEILHMTLPEEHFVPVKAKQAS